MSIWSLGWVDVGSLEFWSHGLGSGDHSIWPLQELSHHIQMAWCWLYHQPESTLSLWYRDRTKDGNGRNKKKFVVILGCKLLVVLWLCTPGCDPRGSSRTVTPPPRQRRVSTLPECRRYACGILVTELIDVGTPN